MEIDLTGTVVSLFSSSRSSCPPPAENATGVLDGSSAAVQGVGTLSASSASLSLVELAEVKAASPLFLSEVPLGQVNSGQHDQRHDHQQNDQASALQHGPHQDLGSRHDGSSARHRRPLSPWDIQLELPRVGWCYQQTVFAVSERAAIYQWKKGHAVPLGVRVRAVPGLQLF